MEGFESDETLAPAWRGEFAAMRRVNETLCVVQKFIYTAGLLVNVRMDGWTYDYDARYCYPTLTDALNALTAMDGRGDPPGNWIKEKVSERLGPGALNDCEMDDAPPSR
jgi:hypothetical protein